MQKKLFFTLALSALISAASIMPKWNLLVYFDPCEEVIHGAFKNITDLARGYNSDEVQIYLQMRIFVSLKPDQDFTYRYKIHNNSLELVECVDMTNDYIHDITQAAKWAFSDSPADHHGIIFCGHGYGILDPKPDENFNESTIHVMDWVVNEDEAFMYGSCKKHTPVQRLERANVMNPLGNNLYLSNHEMVETFAQISQFLGKPLDILGLDLCLAASIEHAYQIAPYVNYLLACENCEWPFNFDYHAISKRLNDNPNIYSPKEFLHDFIPDYASYYEKHMPHKKYQVSAIYCPDMQLLCQSLDHTLHYLMELLDCYPELQEIVMQARNESLHLGFVPMYTDLHQVVENMHTYINESQLLTEPQVDELDHLMEQTKSLISHAIIENFAGSHIAQATGMNIYFPYNCIEESYYSIPFAAQTLWTQFLNRVMR